jgi:hypothetical protein
MLWRCKTLLDIGGWDTGWTSHQEYELLYRSLVHGLQVDTNDHCETLVRQRGTGSITHTTKVSRIPEGIRLRELIWSYLKEKEMDTPQRFEAFRQYVFRQLRGFYRLDRPSAISVHKKYFISSPFVPEDIPVPAYRMLYRVLGFERTERLILWVLRWIRK